MQEVLTWFVTNFLLIAALCSGIFALVKWSDDRKKVAEERMFSDKREHYKSMLLGLKSLREGQTKNLDLLWFEYTFLWLHAPDGVIDSANKLLTKIKDENPAADEYVPLVGELLLQIRKDMGFENTKLRATDFKGKKKYE